MLESSHKVNARGNLTVSMLLPFVVGKIKKRKLERVQVGCDLTVWFEIEERNLTVGEKHLTIQIELSTVAGQKVRSGRELTKTKSTKHT